MEVNVKRLKNLRQLWAMSQKELSEKSGVGRATISRSSVAIRARMGELCGNSLRP
jgi:Trp operon repressor